MILVVNPYGIGNTVLQLPFYMNLRLQYPNKKITLIVFNSVVTPLVDKYVDNIVLFNNKARGLSYFFELLNLFLYLISNKIYAIYILNFFGIKELILAILSGAKYRCAICTNCKISSILTKKIYIKNNMHEVQWWLLFNDVVVYQMPRIEVDNNYIINSNSRRKKIGIHPGCSNYLINKRWKIDNFIKLANILSKDNDVIFYGGPDDKNLIDIIDNQSIGCVNNINKFSLYNTIKNMSDCDIFISNDSGLMHVAAAMDIKVIALFGPSNEFKNRPFNDKSIVIRKSTHDINAIKVLDVLTHVNL